MLSSHKYLINILFKTHFLVVIFLPLMNLVDVLVRFIAPPAPLLGPPLKLEIVLKDVQFIPFIELPPKISPNGEPKKPKGLKNDVLSVFIGLCCLF